MTKNRRHSAIIWISAMCVVQVPGLLNLARTANAGLVDEVAANINRALTGREKSYYDNNVWANDPPPSSDCTAPYRLETPQPQALAPAPVDHRASGRVQQPKAIAPAPYVPQEMATTPLPPAQPDNGLTVGSPTTNFGGWSK